MKTPLLAAAVLLAAVTPAAAQTSADPGYVWVDSNDENGGRNLVRMVPESDDIVAIMECRSHERAVNLVLYALNDRTRSLRLTSGATSVTVTGRTLDDEMTGLRFEGNIPRNSPFWARFQASGQFRAVAGRQTWNEPADAEGRASIGRFLRDCRA